jgi:bifunctional UDP-N-acetylglucosamine pyrophosphorylase/glucosamine-1-phosphate N-acetyltransferase
VNVTPVILAAGYGKRMHSDLPKVMHPILGRPLISWAVDAATVATSQMPVVVVGHGKEQVQACLGSRARYAEQREMLGTGHAVLQSRLMLEGQADAVLVTYGDMPLLTGATLSRLLESYRAARTSAGHAGHPVAIAMLTVARDEPQGFGRIVRNAADEVIAIVEEADCSPEQIKIRELNSGIYCFDGAWLWQALERIQPSPKGEYYLTDTVAMAVADGRSVIALPAPSGEVDGINTRLHLAQATSVMRSRILAQHMEAGVTIIDPATTYIEAGVTIGQDSMIQPGCVLQGATVIGARALIGPYSQIVDSHIGDGCRVVYSVVEQARMDAGSEVGPFGHLRKNAHLGAGVHMGNFGEVKDSYLGPGSKMGHFSYIGNATIGANVNIGAGTITCNYDGVNKHKTLIGDNVFIGSDSMLVAPLTIGDEARTGAGAVVTRDVPPGTTVYGVPARPPKTAGSSDAASA